MDNINIFKKFKKSVFFYQNLKYEFQNTEDIKTHRKIWGRGRSALMVFICVLVIREIEEIPTSKDLSKIGYVDWI